MKRLFICALALILTSPIVSRAQSLDPDRQNPTQYRDVEDGQLLKLVSYILTPFGMALEWGVMRPLHHVATQTSAGPLLRGDIEPSFFSQNNNADHVPPGTFGPYTIDPTNTIRASNDDTSLVPAPRSTTPVPQGTTLAPAESISPSKPLLSGGQPALH
jgi:hypothetical protein